MTRLHGVHTALITPFLASGAVDLNAVSALASRQLTAGVHGLVPCGTTGETPTLTEGEWADVIRATLDATQGRVPITAGVGTNATHSTVKAIESAQALGVNAGLMVFPYYNKPNPDGLRYHVKEALSVGLPLVLYHVPGRTGQHLPAPLLAELSSLKGVIGLKEASGDVHLGMEVMLRTQTPVLSGDDFTFVSLMALGGAGVISVVSNVAPAQTVQLYDAFVSGRVHDVRTKMAQLWPLIRFLFQHSNPLPCKTAMAQMGLCRAEVRAPLLAIPDLCAKGVLKPLGLL